MDSYDSVLCINFGARMNSRLAFAPEKMMASGVLPAFTA
jgi:hypothetical protein